MRLKNLTTVVWHSYFTVTACLFNLIIFNALFKIWEINQEKYFQLKCMCIEQL